MTAYVVDSSVLHRIGRSEKVADRIAQLRRSGQLWACPIVTMELGYSARNHSEWQRIVSAQQGVNTAPVNEQVMARALEVQGLLATRGQHRVSLPDLMIAAAAEAAGVGVLHYDTDYDIIAAVTGQPTEWVTTRGTLS